MKLICTRENFQAAIFKTERVVSRQTTLPVLNNLLLETEKGGLRVSATNLEIGVEVKLGAKIEKEGKITIPARLASNFINSLSQKNTEENLFLESSEKGLRIKTGNAQALIKGLPADEFPLMPKKKAETLLKISAGEIKRALSQVIGCAAFKEARQELTGVSLILSEKELFFAATDSFRLAEKKIVLSEKNINREPYKKISEKKSSIIIPAGTLSELSRIIANDEESEVNIVIEESQIFFEINGASIVSRLINGKYPEYKHIIPREFKTRAVVEKEVLQGAVKMASFFSLGKTSEILLKIDPEKKKAKITAESVEAGESATELDMDINGPEQEIIFNSRYLLDGINMISTSRLAILSNNNQAPVALKEIDEKTGEVLEDYTYIVMPIKNQA